MKTAICTLFEGHYHYGLAALLNSLYKKEFAGHVYVGYRGNLPSWVLKDSENQNISGYGDSKVLSLGQAVTVYFLKLDTEYHFTNYKPNFMIELWDGPARDVETMVYMDPDIVVSMNWSLFDDWFTHGVALCEDINSPVHEFHPKRSSWRKYYKQYGIELKFKSGYYVNGGFVGVNSKFKSFIEDWQKLQEHMADAIGGLSRSSLTGQQLKKEATGIFAPFSKTDQDALNATVEYTSHPTSIIGKEAMGFKAGKALLPHALGIPKPWMNKPLKKFFRGYSPRLIDKLYWKYANGQIKSKPSAEVARNKFFTNTASFLSRFYSRK